MSDQAYSPHDIPSKAQSLIERIDSALSRYGDLIDQLESKTITVTGPGGSEREMAVPTEAGAHTLDNQRVRLEQMNSRLSTIIDRIYL